MQKKEKGCDLGVIHMGNLQEKVHLGRENRSGLAERKKFLAGQEHMSTAPKAGVTVVAAEEHPRSWA